MGYIHRNEWFFYGLLVVAAVVASLPLYSYRWHTLLHMAGAVIFLGNIIVTGAWMLMAERTRSISTIHFSAKTVIRADFLFTLPGVLLILMNGFAMVFSGWGGWSAFHPITWITVPLALFTLSGIIWVGALIPVQHQMVVLSDPSAYPDALPKRFYSSLRSWYIWGGVAIVLPLISLYLMVNKPAFG